jgi:hypothetical protein
MKKVFLITGVFICSQLLNAQSQEAQQLLLNWEKLTQFKQMLRDMYDGWKLIDNGYKQIKDISSGNFNLHKGFLDGLMEVSPAVRKYQKIADITRYQRLILQQCKSASRAFKDDDIFSTVEFQHISNVYKTLFKESVRNLDELILVITSGQLRMNDEERIKAIDRIYERVTDQYSFLRDFNNSTAYLSLQRKNERADIQLSKIILGK